MPSEQEKAELSKKRGQASSQISDPDQRRTFVAAQGESERKGKGTASHEEYEHLNREADDTLATGGANKAVNVPSYKHGTPYVPKTGLAKLHKGERVVPAKDNDMKDMYSKVHEGDSAPRKAIKRIVTHKSHDGKYIHTHEHHHPAHHPDETNVSNDKAEFH